MGPGAELSQHQGGLNQKRKIFNHKPVGIAGLGINTRREPYNDVRVRLALRHLQPRIDGRELMFNEHFLIDSFFPASRYGEPGEPEGPLRPAARFSSSPRAGWKERCQWPPRAKRATADD